MWKTSLAQPKHTASPACSRPGDGPAGGDQGRAHGEVFGAIRPALALVHVLPFLDPKMLVEIELVAQKSV